MNVAIRLSGSTVIRAPFHVALVVRNDEQDALGALFDM
jgi:hypothetical protein